MIATSMIGLSMLRRHWLSRRLGELTLFALPLAWALSARAEPPTENAAQRTIRGTAVIKATEHGQGTGWLYDRERRLLVTNLHVIFEHTLPSDAELGQELRHVVHNRVRLIFPTYRSDGSLIVERDYYKKKEADLIRSGRIVRAVVVDFDPKRDLAILQAESLPKEVRAIPLAASSQQPGDSHFSIGHPGVSTLYWRTTSGSAVSRGFQEWVAATGAGHALYPECVALLTSAKLRPGNSGGPIVNADGQLVAVVSTASADGSASPCIDLSEVRSYLTEAAPLADAKTVEEIQQRGRHYLEQGRIEMAAAEFREAHLRRAEMPEILDDDLLDLAAVTRAQRQFKTSLQWCEKAFSEKNRRPGRAYAERAATRLCELPDEAFTPVDFKGPLWRTRNHADRVNPDYLKAVAAAQQKQDKLWEPRRKEILDDIDEALKEDPRSVLAYRTRAQFLSRMAMPDYRRILADRATVFRLLNNAINQDVTSLLERARTFRDAGQYEEAIADCGAALKIAPRSVLAHVYLATSLLALHRDLEAFHVAAKLIKGKSVGDDFVSLEAMNPANFELVARAAWAMGDYRNAINALDTAILRNESALKRPPERKHYVERGNAYAALKEYDKARAEYRKALKISDPKADQKPDCDAVVLYQERYAIPVIKKKLQDLP